MRRWPILPTRRDAVLGAATVLAPAVVHGQVPARKPRLKPGKDPGGIAVALVGSGVDYTDATIAAALARDGEGEGIAFDVLDGDAQPFDAPAPSWATPLAVSGTAMAREFLSQARGGRLIPLRVSDQNVLLLAKAMSFAGRTPARLAIVFAGPGRDEGHEAFGRVVAGLPHVLVIMPAGKVLRFLEREVPAAYGLGNLTVVTAASDSGAALPMLPTDGARIDVAVALDAPATVPGGLAPADAAAWLENRAAVRLGAIACRMLAETSTLDGAALKARLLALARPMAEEGGPRTRAGVILGAAALTPKGR